MYTKITNVHSRNFVSYISYFLIFDLSHNVVRTPSGRSSDITTFFNILQFPLTIEIRRGGIRFRKSDRIITRHLGWYVNDSPMKYLPEDNGSHQ